MLHLIPVALWFGGAYLIGKCSRPEAPAPCVTSPAVAVVEIRPEPVRVLVEVKR